MSNIWCTFVAKFIARKFQKSPYLVTLLPSSDGGGGGWSTIFDPSNDDWKDNLFDTICIFSFLYKHKTQS